VRERIEALREAGAGLTAVANALNSKGIPTRSGGRWFPATVSQLFRQKAQADRLYVRLSPEG
jgi:hypothetical protein